MPYKDKQKQLANNRLWKQNKKNMMNPSVEIPILSEEPSEVFFHDNRRFELLYDVMTLREMIMKRTNFNIWMNRHLGVLDELHLKKN